MSQNFSDILEDIKRKEKEKLSLKLPLWAEIDGIRIPSHINLEQCSSQSAAFYKASLAEGLDSIADLTSGLGADVWAFSRVCGTVFYNDIDEGLFLAARENFSLLGVKNVSFSNLAASEMLEGLGTVDMIYADPARRNLKGMKVFRLEDCRPDITALLPQIWRHTSRLMLKLSPMADISLVAARLGAVREVHIVGVNGECKELLCLLEKDWNGPYSVTVAELSGSDRHTVEFNPGQSRPLVRPAFPSVGDYLLEALPALSKSGCFSLVCSRFGLAQLDTSTHLFTCSVLPEDISFFRCFRIVEICGFGRSVFKDVGKRYPCADVSARNVPMSSDEFKSRLGISRSGGYHIFAIRACGQKCILVCEKMLRPENMV